MSSLAESVRKQCPELNPDLIEMHFGRMPGSYLDGCSAPEIARHLRLLVLLKAERPVEVEIRPQEAQIYDVVVVGEDRTGVLACITMALAADGFSLRDVRLATYRADEEHAAAPTYFVNLLRVAGDLNTRSVKDVTATLRERLANAFRHMAEGNLAEAQDKIVPRDKIAKSAVQGTVGLLTNMISPLNGSRETQEDFLAVCNLNSAYGSNQ